MRGYHPQRQFTIVVVRTQGDILAQAPLAEMGGRGLFVKEIEVALLQEKVDLAVHSLKDLPTELAPGLVLAAISEREDARDALVTRWNCSLAELPQGARLGTSSPRRAAQLRAFRPDLEIVGLRGNLDTRVRKALEGDLDGAVLAAAGLLRLGMQDRISQYLSPEVCLPAAGQGALAIQCRAQDAGTRELASPLDHLPTRSAVMAERAFIQAVGGGCQRPVAAYGVVQEAELVLWGMVASADGSRVFRGQMRGNIEAPEELGRQLADGIERAIGS